MSKRELRRIAEMKDEPVAWMGKSGRVISAQMKKDCMSISGERDFVPNCTEPGMTAARKAAETYTIPLYAAPAALPDGYVESLRQRLLQYADGESWADGDNLAEQVIDDLREAAALLAVAKDRAIREFIRISVIARGDVPDDIRKGAITLLAAANNY